MSSGNCEICQKDPFKYTCPKCNITYCSVACYKSPAHLRCSEEFYKNCIQDELNSSTTNPGSDVQKIYEILKRIREADSGVQPEDFDDSGSDMEEVLDSDDEQAEGNENCGGADEEDDVCLAARLEGINIEDADEVWERLNASEKEEFKQMVQSGDIMKYLPDYQPWWTRQTQKNSKIVEVTRSANGKIITEAPSNKKSQIPSIAANIPRFADICRKTPSRSVNYNLWNIITAYACVVRHFAGDHMASASEALAQLVNLSATLKYGTNFEEVEDAIVSIEMEALTSNDKAGAIAPVLQVGSRELITKDAYDLMFTDSSKLAALSDILHLMQLVKREMSKKDPVDGLPKQAEFHKLFSLCTGSVELDRKKLRQLIKKIEFFLSFVQENI